MMPMMPRMGSSCPHIFVPDPKNREGQLGPQCKACDGWGFLLKFKGGGPCSDCNGTGVQKTAFQDPAVVAYMAKIRKEMEAIERRAGKLDPGLVKALKLKRLLDIKNTRSSWEEAIWWATANATAVANTTTETILFPNVTVPANYMQDGRLIQFKLNGQHSTLGSGTVTLTFQVRWGGVAGTMICKSAAITQLVSLTAAFWELEISLQTRSNGVAGTVMGSGRATVYGATAPTIGSATGAPAVAPMTNGGQITPAAASLDLTADTALSITVTHGAANASNTVTGICYMGESMN